MRSNVISILMPVYNAEDFLSACIRSILSQDYQEWELLVVDDFSTDMSHLIAQSFADKDSRIKIFKNHHKGIIPALALAFSNSTGNYISRMDADDLMSDNKLSSLLIIASRNPNIVATGKVNYFSATGVSEGYKRYEIWLNQVAQENSFSKNMYRECVIASPNWMVHRSCFDEIIALNDLNYPEDYDLVLKWYSKGFQFIADERVTHLWREHEKRTSRNSEVYQQESFFKIKTEFFIQNEVGKNEKVQLIGSGVKGKLVAKILTKNAVQFDWFEYSKNKKKSNYLNVENLDPEKKTILTNWPLNKIDQSEILNFLDKLGFEFGSSVWLF